MTNSRFFVGSDGNLYRDNIFSAPIREKFQHTFSRISNTAEFKATLRNGAYAWPGGYPLYFIMSDCQPMCFDCARKEAKQIISAMRDNWNTGWEVAACDINYEDKECYCCHCNSKIESAYGDEEGESEEE